MPHTNIPAPENHSKITPGEKHTFEKEKRHHLASDLLASKWTYCRHLDILNLFFTKPGVMKLEPGSDSPGRLLKQHVTNPLVLLWPPALD